MDHNVYSFDPSSTTVDFFLISNSGTLGVSVEYSTGPDLICMRLPKQLVEIDTNNRYRFTTNTGESMESIVQQALALTGNYSRPDRIPANSSYIKTVQSNSTMTYHITTSPVSSYGYDYVFNGIVPMNFIFNGVYITIMQIPSMIFRFVNYEIFN